jgi:hypothetical protein
VHFQFVGVEAVREVSLHLNLIRGEARTVGHLLLVDTMDGGVRLERRMNVFGRGIWPPFILSEPNSWH